MAAYTSLKDARLLADAMVDRGCSEEEMLSAKPVFDSVPDDEAERVWRAIVESSRS